jgi:hypothetical protein
MKTKKVEFNDYIGVLGNVTIVDDVICHTLEASPDKVLEELKKWAANRREIIQRWQQELNTVERIIDESKMDSTPVRVERRSSRSESRS